MKRWDVIPQISLETIGAPSDWPRLWLLCRRAFVGVVRFRPSPRPQRTAQEAAAAYAARLKRRAEKRARLFIWQRAFWTDPKELLRPKSLFNRKQLTRAEIAFGKATMLRDAHVSRPETRGECLGHQGPCPFFSCRHHTGIELNEIGSLKVTFPGFDVDEIPETCSLDVADKGNQTIETVSTIMNLSEEWIRQIEAEAVRKMRRGLGDYQARRLLRVVLDNEGHSQDPRPAQEIEDWERDADEPLPPTKGHGTP